MSRSFDKVTDPVLGEEVFVTRTSRGLPLRVVPTTRFAETAAVVTFAYGSTDLGFVRNGQAQRTPEGMAHYLEHKLFEDEELQAFDRFARRGAKVNAMTGFAQTSYYFTATDQFEANLKDLLHLVSRAHITPENVEKERGIIAQEIRMYEDNPVYRGFFDFLGCLYREHPVRHPVGGTVESIAEITAEGLLACFEAFYTCGNAALAVAGPVEPEAVLALVEQAAMVEGPAPERVLCEDLGPVQEQFHERSLQVARDRVLCGFKDRDLPGDPEAQRRRSLQSRVVLDAMFGNASDEREALRRQGVVDVSLSASYMSEPSFGVTALGCETEDPQQVIDALRALCFDLGRSGLGEEHLERVRRSVLGGYVRSFESVKGLAFNHAKEALDGIEPFAGLARVQSLQLEELHERHRSCFVEDSFAAAVIRRQGVSA